MPRGSKQKLRFGGRHCEVGNANLGAEVEDSRPVGSSVDGLINAAFGIRSVDMAERADVNDIRILRVDHDFADLARVFEADMGPGCACVSGFINAVTGGKVFANVGLAGPGVDNPGVRWRCGESANRADVLAVEDRVQVTPASIVFQMPPLTAPK